MATLKYKNPATSAWETLDALPAIGQTVEITATELAGKSTADRATMYAAGTLLLKVVNGDTEVLLGLGADGSTEWLGSNKPIRNLLDNSDFANPVNQRGATSVTDGYSIDRWRNWAANSSSVTINNSSISVVGTLLQYVDNIKPGSVLTFAYGNESQTVIASNWGISPENNVAYFNIETGTWTWAAVYSGAYTADTLPPYTPKGYAAELAECQRYYQRINASYPIMASGYTIGTNAARIAAQLQNVMRIAPTVTVDATKVGIIYNGQYLYAESANWSTEVAKKKPIISADITLSGAPLQGLGYPIITYLEADIDVSADL